MNERTLQTRIINYLKRDGWIVYKNPPSRIGRPDIEAFKDGKAIFLELKNGRKGKLGIYQAKELLALRRAGFIAEVVSTWEEFLEILRRV